MNVLRILGILICCTILCIAAASETIPIQLRIAFGDNPKTSMSVMWQTEQTTKASIVQYGTSPNTLKQTAAGKRATYPQETGVLHEVLLTGLKPNTQYYYRAGDPEGGWSGIYSFRTAPARVQDFVFTAFGDHGVTRASMENLNNIIRIRPAFHLLLGDISYANGRQPIWDIYLKMVEPLTRTIPYMLTLGNHENERIDGERIGYVATLTRFAMPEKESYYAFDYCGSRFIAFNSDDYRNPEQLQWLEETLKSARADKSVRWIVVFHHHPPYGSVRGRENNAGLIQVVTPLYDKYQVDLVLNGHDHVYERIYALRDSKIVNSSLTEYRKGEGTVYVTCGGGGQSLYDFVPDKPELTALREKTYCYLRVLVPARGALAVEAYRSDGTLIEKFMIK